MSDKLEHCRCEARLALASGHDGGYGAVPRLRWRWALEMVSSGRYYASLLARARCNAREGRAPRSCARPCAAGRRAAVAARVRAPAAIAPLVDVARRAGDVADALAR